jgi:hypothetical protein
MTAHLSTQRALAAVAAGDLDALAQALAAREAALRAAPLAEQAAALHDGANLARNLAGLKRDLAAEHARWEQLRAGFANYRACLSSSRSIDVCA